MVVFIAFFRGDSGDYMSEKECKLLDPSQVVKSEAGEVLFAIKQKISSSNGVPFCLFQKREAFCKTEADKQKLAIHFEAIRLICNKLHIGLVDITAISKEIDREIHQTMQGKTDKESLSHILPCDLNLTVFDYAINGYSDLVVGIKSA